MTESYFGSVKGEWEKDLKSFADEFTQLSSAKESSEMEKKALTKIGELKGHLKKIEGLFISFKHSLNHAFKLNSGLTTELNNLETTRRHDIMKLIAFSVATVGLTVVSFVSSDLSPMT